MSSADKQSDRNKIPDPGIRITVAVAAIYIDRMSEVMSDLRICGMDVEGHNADLGTIEGRAPKHLIKELDVVPGVRGIIENRR